jgi:serine/threonine protein phosphatase PrpC
MIPNALHDMPALRVHSVSRSHVGRVRRENEDRVLDRPDASLWAVADGMGGQRHGAAAATRVIAALDELPHGASGYALLADMARSLQLANDALQADAGGSTLVALLIREGHYACLWAGDSRAYRLRNGRLEAITRDHSVVQQMIDSGALSEAERRGHPRAHVITRAIGIEGRLTLDRQFESVLPGDRFLLCSDGLNACLGEAQLAGFLAQPELAIAADAMLEAALEEGAPDNVSFVLIAAE